jgi:ABC-type branched-subunit amino acid transport system permease subunit
MFGADYWREVGRRRRRLQRMNRLAGWASLGAVAALGAFTWSLLTGFHPLWWRALTWVAAAAIVGCLLGGRPGGGR